MSDVEEKSRQLDEGFRRWKECLLELEKANEAKRPLMSWNGLGPQLSARPTITMPTNVVQRIRQQLWVMRLTVAELLGLNANDEDTFTPGAIADAMKRRAWRAHKEPDFLKEACEMLEQAVHFGINESLVLRIRLWLERVSRL